MLLTFCVLGPWIYTNTYGSMLYVNRHKTLRVLVRNSSSSIFKQIEKKHNLYTYASDNLRSTCRYFTL